MADEDDFPASLMMAFGLDMHLGDKRAGRVDIDHVAAFGFGRDGFRHPMRGKDDGPVWRALVQLFYKDGAQLFEAGDNVLIVDDFMAHIDRGAPFAERLFDDLDSAINPGAKTTGGGESDLKFAAVH